MGERATGAGHKRAARTGDGTARQSPGGASRAVARAAALAVALGLPATLAAQQLGSGTGTLREDTGQQTTQQQAPQPQATPPQTRQQPAGGPQPSPEAGGGLRMTFGLDTRLETRSNPRFRPGGSESATEAVARLSFGLISETRTDRLAFEGGAELRGTLDGPSDTASGLVNPNLRLSYGRSSAGATFDTSLFLRETDLARSDNIDEFDDPAGIRRDVGGNVAFAWGNDAPVGYGLTASHTDTSFADGATEADRRRSSVGATLRLDVSQATSLTFALGRSRFDEDGAETRDTTTASATAAFARPDGALTLGLRAEDTPEGTRSALTAGRSFALPDGALSLGIGVTRGASGDAALSGSVGWSRELPRGQISASLSRDVTSGTEDDSEREITSARLGLTQSLTQRTSLSLNLGLSESRQTADDTTTRNATASATFSHALPQDWALDAGVSYRSREETFEGTARDTQVFLGLRRAFEIRY